MEEILVPTDFSGVSDTASEAAIQLAKRGDFEVLFIHLITVDRADTDTPKGRHQFQKEVMKQVSSKSKKLETYVEHAHNEHVKADKIIQYDKSYRSLIDYIAHNHIYMVVMGSHGSKGTRELLVGSNSQMVARFSPIPVLVVKEGYLKKELQHMIFVSDFEDPPGLGFEKAVAIVAELNMTLHFLSIIVSESTKDTEIYDRISRYESKQNTIESIRVQKAKDLETGITEYADMYPSDLICMVTHKTQRASTVLHSSLTERMINHLSLPVLCLHD